jgi:predicted nucleotidyltransferase
LDELLVKEAKRRREVFRNLQKILEEIKKILINMDKESRVFLFGSVVKEEYALTSDIDVLILTKLKPSEVIARLREKGFDEPLEFHVVDDKTFNFYRQLIRELKEL